MTLTRGVFIRCRQARGGHNTAVRLGFSASAHRASLCDITKGGWGRLVAGGPAHAKVSRQKARGRAPHFSSSDGQMTAPSARARSWKRGRQNGGWGDGHGGLHPPLIRGGRPLAIDRIMLIQSRNSQARSIGLPLSRSQCRARGVSAATKRLRRKKFRCYGSDSQEK